jgi:hypothetical protein
MDHYPKLLMHNTKLEYTEGKTIQKTPKNSFCSELQKETLSNREKYPKWSPNLHNQKKFSNIFATSNLVVDKYSL